MKGYDMIFQVLPPAFKERSLILCTNLRDDEGPFIKSGKTARSASARISQAPISSLKRSKGLTWQSAQLDRMLDSGAFQGESILRYTLSMKLKLVIWLVVRLSIRNILGCVGCV